MNLMLLSELFQSEGTYIGLRPMDSTLALLYEWAEESKVSLDENLHVTELYSRKVIQPAINQIEHLATPLEFEVLSGSIVLKLNAPSIVSRHNELINLGGTHDFPEFIPHITLIKDPGELSISDLLPINFGLVFGNEYIEELKLS